MITITSYINKKSNHDKIKLISKLSTKTSRGILSKGWYLVNDKICLVKGNTEGSYEPIAEYIGSRVSYALSKGFTIIYDLKDSYLFSQIKVFNEFPYVSVCSRWNFDSTQQFSKYVDYIEQKYISDYRMWLLTKASSKLLYQVSLLLFIDAIIGNQDRRLNNWDIVESKTELAPFIDFGASCLSWNLKELNKIINSNSIYPDISQPFAKTHLQQLRLIKKFLQKDNQKLEIPNPYFVVDTVLEECSWLSSEFSTYYEAVSKYLRRRVDRVYTEMQNYVTIE